MTEASWQQRLQQNMRDTAQFWSEEGESIEGDNGHSPAAARLIAMGLSVGSAALATMAGVHTLAASGELAAHTQSVIGSVGWYCGAIAGIASIPSAVDWLESWRSGPRETIVCDIDDTQRQESTIRQNVSELFARLDSEPNGRAEIMRLLQSDSGRQLFLNAMESQSLEQTANHLLKTHNGVSDAISPEDDDASPGPSMT